MTNLYIESEGDIEYGVEHCVELAKLRGTKFITLAFPSKFVYQVFMHNLCDVLEADSSLPEIVDIEATIVIPTWENNDE
jgi:hypothetical protein